MTRIAIEATGCDKGFNEVLEGAKKASKKNSDLELILVAGKDRLPKEYHDLNGVEGINLEKIEYTYNPKKAKDSKENKSSSIYRTIEMQKFGDLDAVIAPGITGATVFYSFKMLDRLSKLRPAIACNFSNNILVDAGANLKCKPEYYRQYAILGNVLSKFYLGIKDPLIGIANIATEDSVGYGLAIESKPLVDKLKDKGYRIHDEFFEPNIFRNPGEGFREGLVCVADALITNIMLKTAETCFEIGGDLVKKGFKTEPRWSKLLGAIPFKRIYNKLRNKVDYRSFAAAPLLGYKGNVMICHGRSDAEAIENAILITYKYVEKNINDQIKKEFERCKDVLNLSAI